MPLSPVHPLDLAQKDFLRLAALLPGLTLPVTGAFKLDPVALLYLARPLAVSPAPCLTDLFSPRPTERFTFLVIHNHPRFLVDRLDFVFLAVLAACLKFFAVGAPFDPGFRMVSPDPALILFRFAWMFA